MRKILFSLNLEGSVFPEPGECPIVIDCFAKLEADYGWTQGHRYDPNNDMHPLEIDPAFGRDTRTLWGISMRTRFAGVPREICNVYCLCIDDDSVFDSFTSDNLQQLIATKHSTGELKDFLNSAKV